MSESHERTIRDLLLNDGNSDLVADNLLHRLRIESPGLKERKVFLSFIINAGFTRHALELYEIWFTEKRRIPFFQFCHLLSQSGFSPRADFVRHLLRANEEATDSQPLTHFTPWEQANAEIKNQRQLTVEKLQQSAHEHHQNQLAKLEYLRVNRMIEEEEVLLDQLLMAYPDDTQLRREKESFRSRWAEAIIARKADHFAGLDELAPTEPNITALELKALSSLADGMIDAAKTHPNSAYNLAIGLYLLELYNPAMIALSFAPTTLAADWFAIDCLIKARRFAEALDAISNIESRYADDPETTFGATYTRALSLEGLGQRGPAVELLNSIVQVRPAYRSAQLYLLKWDGGRV